jgi:hypothetical protein
MLLNFGNRQRVHSCRRSKQFVTLHWERSRHCFPQVVLKSHIRKLEHARFPDIALFR